MTTFFGFGIAPSMFPGNCNITRTELSPTGAKNLIEAGVVPCLNPSHAATIAAMRERFGIDCEIPGKAPVVKLEYGDSLLVMGVSGLPRLEGRHEYTNEEIAAARFDFSLWRVAK